MAEVHDNSQSASKSQNLPATAGGDPSAPIPSAAPATAAGPSPEVLKAAMKAFKKRLKLTMLDDESRIGRGPMSGGQRSTIAGITAPDQYPRQVWDELVRQGKLKDAGHGMYAPA